MCSLRHRNGRGGGGLGERYEGDVVALEHHAPNSLRRVLFSVDLRGRMSDDMEE